METPRRSKASEVRKVVGYVRVSTGAQAENGFSLDAQEKAIRGWAESRGFDYAGTYRDEGVSGTRSDRRGLEDAKAHAIREKAILVAYSLSRLSRSTMQADRLFDDLEKAGTGAASVTEPFDTTTDIGKAMRKIIGVFAELEAATIRARVRSGLQERRAQGLKLGGKLAPFGYKLHGKRLVEIPEERELVKLALRWRKAGRSLREIAEALDARGATTHGGAKKWSAQSVSDLLRREGTR